MVFHQTLVGSLYTHLLIKAYPHTHLRSAHCQLHITAHNPPSTMVSKQKLFSHTVMAFNCMSVQEPRYLSDQITTRIAVTRRMT